MNCERVRRELVSGHFGSRSAIDDHLADCDACASYAERLATVHEALEDHHAGATPDAAFAARVVAQLPPRPSVMGWAALRLLPAATALLLVLSAWAWLGAETSAESALAAPTDDLVSWVLENGGVGE